MFHQIWGERDLAHPKFPAVLLCMLHTLGLEGVQSLNAWAKGVPIKGRERGIHKEGMEFGQEEVAMGRLEEELVVRIPGRWDSTRQLVSLWPDNFLTWFPNQGSLV